MSLGDQLSRGLDALDIDLAAPTRQRLLDYVALLAKWNRVHNLTALREDQSLVSHHLLDSLAVLPYLSGDSMVDVGSGAGLPGIPLALARPDWQVTLLDSSHKKTSFLQQAKIELGLANVSVICSRVEAWQAPHGYALVISRALSELAEFVRLAAPLLAPDGVLAAMKGVYPYEEIAQLPPGFKVEQVVPLAVPGLEGARHLVLVRKARPNG